MTYFVWNGTLTQSISFAICVLEFPFCFVIVEYLAVQSSAGSVCVCVSKILVLENILLTNIMIPTLCLCFFQLLSSYRIKYIITFCRMTNYKLLCWLVETRSRDVGHNRMLHSWASDCATFFHSDVHVARVTFYHSVTHVTRLFPKLAENENRTNTSNLRWVDLYWDNARMRMYGHDVQSINELFIAERNTN